jgi:DnaJ family protein C protein 7
MKELGNVQFKNNNYTSAIEYYSRGIDLNPSEPILYANRATCYKCLGRYKESIRDYKKAVSLSPRNIKNLKKLSSVYIIEGNFGEAQILLEKCCNLEPNNSSHYYELNKIKKMVEDFEKVKEKIKEQKWADAEEKAKALLVDAPSFSELQKMYIQSCLELCKLDDVINYIKNQVSSYAKAKDEDFNFLLAKTYYFKGEYDLAKREINNLIKQGFNDNKFIKLKKNIESIDNAKTRANNFFKNQNYDKAIQEYNELLNFDPENKNFMSIILTNRALCYKKKGNNMEALKDVDQAIEYNPNYSTAYIRRALVYEELKMFDDAKSDLSKAKELEPNNPKIEGYINEANHKAEIARKRDYYKILGINKNATPPEIKKAYRKMAIKYHPDRNGESDQTKKVAQRKFQDVSDAYSVLSDPKKKEMYDQGVDPLNPETASGPTGPSSNIHFSGGDPNEMFKMFFNGNGGQTFFRTSSSGPGNFSKVKFFKMGNNGNDSEDDFSFGGDFPGFGSFFEEGDPFSSFFKMAQKRKKN